jgi:hypothetical protein
LHDRHPDDLRMTIRRDHLGAPQIVVRLELASPTSVRLTIHDIAGRRRQTLLDGSLPGGVTDVPWDRRDRRGADGERDVLRPPYVCVWCARFEDPSAEIGADSYGQAPAPCNARGGALAGGAGTAVADIDVLAPRWSQSDTTQVLGIGAGPVGGPTWMRGEIRDHGRANGDGFQPSVSHSVATVRGSWASGGPVADPNLVGANGNVVGMARSGNTLYIAGSFRSVGENIGGLVQVDARTSEVLRPFPKVAGYVYALVPDGSGGWYLGVSSPPWAGSPFLPSPGEGGWLCLGLESERHRLAWIYRSTRSLGTRSVSRPCVCWRWFSRDRWAAAREPRLCGRAYGPGARLESRHL